MEPLLQKLADIVQVTTDKVAEMYPTLVQEATWYTVIQNTQQFAGWALFLSICAAIIIGVVSIPLCDEHNFAQEFGQRIAKVLKIEAIVVCVLTSVLAVATIFGPLLYPNLNLFKHFFK